MEGELLLGAKGTKRASASTSKPTADKKKKYASPSGNRTPVSCVTGRDTYHYTNEDWLVEKPPKLQNTTYRQRYREKKVAEPTPRGRGHTLATKRGKAREGEEEKKKFTPSSRIRTSDLWMSVTCCQLQSTALPTELSKVAMIRSSENTTLSKVTP